MAQISRPFQIALVAMVLFALVWVVALRGHSPSTSSSGSSAPAPSSSPAAPGSAYHGSAPGVEGLSRAIAKAHGAVTASQQNAKQLQERSARASGETPASTAPSAPKASPSAPAASHAKSAPAPVHAHARAKSHAAPIPVPRHAKAAPGAAKTTAPSMQVKVEAELKQGKVVAILFWNPKATDDVAVQHQLQSVQKKLRSSIAVHAAMAGQVASFGTIIRGVKVYGTPTLMIVDKHKQALTLTGYTDAYAIEQAIGEARHA